MDIDCLLVFLILVTIKPHNKKYFIVLTLIENRSKDTQILARVHPFYIGPCSSNHAENKSNGNIAPVDDKNHRETVSKLHIDLFTSENPKKNTIAISRKV